MDKQDDDLMPTKLYAVLRWMETCLVDGEPAGLSGCDGVLPVFISEEEAREKADGAPVIELEMSEGER